MTQVVFPAPIQVSAQFRVSPLSDNDTACRHSRQRVRVLYSLRRLDLVRDALVSALLQVVSDFCLGHPVRCCFEPHDDGAHRHCPVLVVRRQPFRGDTTDSPALPFLVQDRPQVQVDGPQLPEDFPEHIDHRVFVFVPRPHLAQLHVPSCRANSGLASGSVQMTGVR